MRDDDLPDPLATPRQTHAIDQGLASARVVGAACAALYTEAVARGMPPDAALAVTLAYLATLLSPSHR